jgi:hypothetical protein
MERVPGEIQCCGSRWFHSMSRRANVRKRKRQRARHKLPQQKFAQHADPEAKGILGRVIAAQTIVDAMPKSTISIPPPTPLNIMREVLAEQNRS